MKSRLVLCLSLYVALLFCSGCHKKPPEFKGYPVKIGEVTLEDVPEFIKGVGQLCASLQADMKAQVSGELTAVLFNDGKTVEEGDLLMTLDARIYEAHVQQATAQLAQDRAKLRFALDFAETYGKLVGKDYVSRLEYEHAIQEVDTYKAAVELDMAALKKAQVDLEYTQLRAPFKGHIGLRKYDPGNFIDASVGQTLVTVRRINPLCIKFYFPSEYGQALREKQKEAALYLEAEIPDDPSHPLPGTLWFIDNFINPQTGMILLEGTIPNPEERGWPGQFVRVRVRLKTWVNAVLVPSSALVLGESGNFVFVLNKDQQHVTMRSVGKGFVYKDTTVVLWGLNGGEKVVVDGQLNLYDGAKVYIPATETR